MRSYLFGMAVLSGFVFTACEVPQNEDAPRVSISEPQEGAELLSTDTVQFVFDVDNFDLDADAVGDDPEAGHGHIHLFLDDGENALKTTASALLDIDLSSLELTPGLHTFRAVLFENDHTIIEDAISDAVEVNISAP